MFLLWCSIYLAFSIGTVYCISRYYLQNKLIYFPDIPADSRTKFYTPETFGISNYEQVYILTPDGERLFAWLFKVGDSIENDRPTMVYFHGNAGNLSHRLQNIAEILRFVHVNILAVEYRGYGKSTGTPSEFGLQLDAQSVLQWLLLYPHINRSKILLFGRSLGGAVAIYLASLFPKSIRLLIVENTFTSISAIAYRLFPALKYLKFVSFTQWDSETLIKSIDLPCLFLAGKRDQLIPTSMMQTLYRQCRSGKKSWIEFENGEHMNTWEMSGYYEQLSNWIETTCK